MVSNFPLFADDAKTISDVNSSHQQQDLMKMELWCARDFKQLISYKVQGLDIR